MDPRHIHMDLIIENISPYILGDKSQSYNIWSILLTNYNISPWYLIKKDHFMLSMMIFDLKQAKNIDIYLTPLIDELKLLWKEVPAYDGQKLTRGLS